MLTGEILSIEPVRYTPAGLPRQRLWVEHRSRQEEAGHPREVRAKFAVILTGTETVRSAETLAPGERIRVTGFLSRAGIRGEARDRLQLHAQTLNRLD